MEEPAFRAALIAANSAAEIQSIQGLVENELADWDLEGFADLSELMAATRARNFYPDLTVVCQRFRDQFAAREIEPALMQLPLARWICVYGAWCESEGRHGSLWPTAFRVPVRSFHARLIAEVAVVEGRRHALPITADREEIFEFDSVTEFPQVPRANASAVVIGSDREIRLWLIDLLNGAGLKPISHSPEKSPDAVVIDLDPVSKNSCSQLSSLKQQYPAARIIAMRDRLDLSVDRQLEAAGADLVVSKLSPPAQLAFEMRSCLR